MNKTYLILTAEKFDTFKGSKEDAIAKAQATDGALRVMALDGSEVVWQAEQTSAPLPPKKGGK